MITYEELHTWLVAGVVSLVALLLAGCASMVPTQMVNGVAIYVRDHETVERYCRYRVRPEDRLAHIYGCHSPKDNMIMVEDGHPAVLAHELRHAQGWNHRGPCHSTEADPNGRKPDGTPCEWYRR